MGEGQLTVNELTNLINEFKNKECQMYLYWGNNTNYKLYNTLFKEEELKDFKNIVLNTIEEALKNRVISNYDIECSADDVIEVYPSDTIEKYKEVEQRIKNEEILSIGSKTNLERVNFIVFKLCIDTDEEEKVITVIKRFNKPSTVFKQALKYRIIGNEMKRIKEDVIYLDEQVDAFEYNNTFYILNRNKFNTIFKFRDEYYKLIDNKEDYIKNTHFIDNPEDFLNKCKDNANYVKKMAKIIKNEGFENLEKNKHKVKDVIKKHKLDIKVDSNNRIIYNEENIGEILNLLLDHYVISELSEKRAIAKALDYETEE